jgi:ubiquinone/menaquinone biosynthesis C-methylase UbiE
MVYHIGTRNLSNRESWLKGTLKKIPSGFRILDAGAGEQKYKKYCSHLNYISQDFAKYEGHGNGRGLQTGSWDQSYLDIISDITSIPQPDSSFDAIMCIEVFEHLPEPIKAISEFSRLLRNNGYLILTAPFCSLTHFAPYHYYSGFNRYFYEKNLSEYEFKIIELEENGNYFEYIAQELRRIPDVAKDYCPDKRVSFIDLIAIQKCLLMLQKFSKNDNGSSELLHFGCHVFAQKR